MTTGKKKTKKDSLDVIKIDESLKRALVGGEPTKNIFTPLRKTKKI